MKKIVLMAIAVLGTQFAIAQETETTTTTSSQQPLGKRERPFNFYFGFGVNVVGDYKINDKLKASDMPEIATTLPEFTFGFNYDNGDETNFYHDLEFSIGYVDKKTTEDRMKATVAYGRLRPQYKFVNTDSYFFSAGLDLVYSQTYINLYSRGNTIDLDDLNPGTHTGHIAMRSGQFALGPAVALGLFQNKTFPIRINAGYNIGLSKGKWKSDFASVTNSVNESGLGNLYAKVSIGF